MLHKCGWDTYSYRTKIWEETETPTLKRSSSSSLHFEFQNYTRFNKSISFKSLECIEENLKNLRCRYGDNMSPTSLFTECKYRMLQFHPSYPKLLSSTYMDGILFIFLCRIDLQTCQDSVCGLVWFVLPWIILTRFEDDNWAAVYPWCDTMLISAPKLKRSLHPCVFSDLAQRCSAGMR